ncbi:MAG TPA: DUF1365 domain-containing protein [Aquabacterium sp.]|uniref:DUF1365 domain-containing protein n=1 Tax=Aquabacterium sp. TaxID=1872578 RepID=UPI002E2F5C47|nr:DUF1365 domain-containing protein [Aquabacterium sp.]HEX5355850.1 DUF1365 domain-containing protein [Aquabacterium sp.]
MSTGLPSGKAMIGFGEVRHARLRPARHAFRYGSYFWLLPMRALRQQAQASVRRNQRAWLSFHDADHGAGGPDALSWLDGLLKDEGLWHDDLTQGEVWLQTYPRVLGYTFKPVSFWYVHRPDGVLHAIVVEVNNTFGERHCYLLGGAQLGWGREMSADKVFHVSPFCEARGGYRFRFMRTADRLIARVDHDDGQGPLIQTAINGVLHELNAHSVRRAIWGWPLMTFGVVARIHWQALQLWLKRVPFFSKPEPPSRFATGSHTRSTS